MVYVPLALSLRLDLARVVIGVADDCRIGAIGKSRQSPRRVVVIVNGKAGLVDHLCAATGAVVLVLQELAARVIDLLELIMWVINERHGAVGRINDRGQIAVRVVGQGHLRAIGERLGKQAAG